MQFRFGVGVVAFRELRDYLVNRKWLAVFAYVLGAVRKPFLQSHPHVLSARFVDRIGKGIRGAPRGALAADMTPSHLRGAPFGLRQALDTVCALAGPLLAVGLMVLWANDFRRIFWIAVIPGVTAVVLLAVGVREPAKQQEDQANLAAKHEKLIPPFWWVVVVGALARFSEAFLILQAMECGMSNALIPLVMAMNAVYAISAYPFGKLADPTEHRKLLSALDMIAIITAVYSPKLDISMRANMSFKWTCRSKLAATTDLSQAQQEQWQWAVLCLLPAQILAPLVLSSIALSTD